MVFHALTRGWRPGIGSSGHLQPDGISRSGLVPVARVRHECDRDAGYPRLEIVVLADIFGLNNNFFLI